MMRKKCSVSELFSGLICPVTGENGDDDIFIPQLKKPPGGSFGYVLGYGYSIRHFLPLVQLIGQLQEFGRTETQVVFSTVLERH